MIADAPCATDAVVLAAGLSRRTFPRHKLLARDANGRPMIATTIRRIQASTVRRIIIVLGHRADEVHDALMPWLDAHRPLPHLIHAPDHARGLSASLCAGSKRAGGQGGCGAHLPCRHALVPTGLLDRMIATHAACHPSAVTVMHDGRRGHPVLWDRRMFPDLLRIDGDRGARDLLRRMGHGLLQLEAGPEIHEDFDTPARLERFSTLSPVS